MFNERIFSRLSCIVLQWLRTFFDFPVEFSVSLIEFQISSLIVDDVRVPPGVANLTSNYECPNPFSVRYKTVYLVFSNFFQKTQITKKLTENSKFPTLQLIAVRVLSRVAVLASPCSSRDMTCFMIFSKILDIKKLTRIEFLNSIMGCCQGNFKGFKPGIQL